MNHWACADDPAQQALLVLRIQDLECLGQPCLLPVHAEQAMGDAVECPDPQGPSRDPEQVAGALAHFAGRLVREGDRQHTQR
jgi:hypothetical protein